MSIVARFVGLDYHEDSVQVCVVNAEGVTLVNRSAPNCVEAVGELIWSYGPPRCVAIEACCGAADFIEQLAQRYQFDVRMAHPGYVRRLKQSPDKSASKMPRSWPICCVSTTCRRSGWRRPQRDNSGGCPVIDKDWRTTASASSSASAPCCAKNV